MESNSGHTLESWNVSSFLCVTLLTLLLVKVIQFALLPLTNVREMGLPAPNVLPIIGHLHLLIKQGMPYLDLECYMKYRKQHKAYCTAMFSEVTMVPCDISLIKAILVKEFHAFTDRQVPNINTRPVDRGLIFIEGDHWRTIRGFVSPAFTARKMRIMNPLVMGAADNMTRRLTRDATNATNISMKELFGAYTLDVVARTMFGLDLDSQTSVQDPFVHHAKHAFKVQPTNPFLILGVLCPSLAPVIRRYGLGFISHQSILFFQGVIQQALHVRQHNQDRGDFLQMAVEELVGAEKIDCSQRSAGETYKYSSKGLLLEDIEAQAVSFFLAGYETTATSLTLLSYILAQHQEVQDKIREEISSVLGDQVPTYDNVKDLAYMDMCISESLRLFPPSVRVTRKCTRTVSVCGLTIHAGTGVAIPVYALHRDPDVWPQPDSFRPERFLPEAVASRSAYHYLPFGLGPRRCVGMRLALLEMKVGLVQFIRAFRLVPTEGMVPVEELELACTGLLAPKHDITLRVEPID